MLLKISAVQVLAWLGATFIATLTLTAGAYAIFETKGEAKQMESHLVRELQYIREELRDIKNALKKR